MTSVVITPRDAPPVRKSRQRWSRAIIVSLAMHGGLGAWAAQELRQWSLRWSLPAGTNSSPAIEAHFSEGDLNTEQVRDRSDDLALQIMKSVERASPEDRLLTGGRLLAIDKQPLEPPEPTLTPLGESQPAPTPVLVAAASAAATQATVDADSPLSAVPRAKPSQQVHVEPIEPTVASASSIASTADSGASRTPPSVIENPPPVYPPEALARRLTGRVLIRVRLDDRGHVGDASVYRSSGEPLLDEAALNAVRRWRFQTPGSQFLGEFALPVNFVLR
ncbi:MAG: energy transducer TonB [Planctomycetaceae bacterium]|nr:energy transducer TonB [Planctomycetaceae bacterium]